MARVTQKWRNGRKVIAGLSIVIAGATGMAVAITGAGGATHASTTTDTQIPSSTSLSQMASEGIASINASAPEPTLPAAQSAAWIADFQAMANCMHAHGIADFPNAPATFGDGKTPAPVTDGPSGSDMDPQSTTFQSANAACPMNTSNLSMSAFQSSWSQWQASHPTTSSGPAVPGQQPGTP
jgi:hypothetical protein